eukprot:TRINITY_DN379_c2_g1_i1.p1 TRINITY_DN379_c2_g1~~TRINITY_DN379_c2_g1_i1.p1  ORF type:complete len:101 (-),score=5.18 TRINITY_DN379_c2_g1_i1:112-414(-)
MCHTAPVAKASRPFSKSPASASPVLAPSSCSWDCEFRITAERFQIVRPSFSACVVALVSCPRPPFCPSPQVPRSFPSLLTSSLFVSLQRQRPREKKRMTL